MSAKSIDDLIAADAIKEALALYCRAMDRIDDALGMSLWTEDATLEYVGIYSGTAKGFIDLAHEQHAGMLVTKHRIVNHLIRVTGDTAVSEADGRITLVTQDDEGIRVRTSFGRYLDHWVRRGERWLINHRLYTRDFSLLSRPTLELGTGVRSRADASYDLFPTDG